MPNGFFDEEDELDADPSVVPEAPAAAPMNPMVKDYLTKKFDLGNYNDENRQKLVDENSGNSGSSHAMAALAALGAGFMGQNPSTAGAAVLDRDRSERQQKIDQFDKARAGKIQEYGLGRQATKDTREDDVFNREADVNSEESKMANELAQRMGYKGSPVTAQQFKGFSPALQKMYDIEQRKLDRKEARDERRYEAGMRLDDKKEDRIRRQEEKEADIARKNEEKEAKLRTPFGTANNEDDAKKLKEAAESKSVFDEKINEMIALREKHGGGAMMNREDVARGKQLSKDLLLEYKNMAKLGVLSKSDEDIINAIIPADPLEYNSPLAALQGQDPILHKLKSFKNDSDKDFSNRVSTRTRDGSFTPKVADKTVIKTQTNQKTGQKRIVYNDGTTEIVNSTAGR